MRRSERYRIRAGLLAVVAVVGALPWLARTQSVGVVAIDPDDIGGIVTSSRGPEAGVWVIAETNDLQPRFIRIVVTDVQGRYVVPDLPKATYDVFVRGYGLVDSPRVRAKPGQQLSLKAIVAPDGKAAAQLYPASYWLSLLDASDREVTSTVKENCLACHQLGNRATREIARTAGAFKTSLEAWDQRIRVGPNGSDMSASFMKLGPGRKAFADWTDSIAAGALPTDPPTRPSGMERNVVITQWDFGTATSFTYSPAASDRRNPTVNANGKIYAPDRSHDALVWLDPVEHKTGEVKIPTRDSKLKRVFLSAPLAGSPYWPEQDEYDLWNGVTDVRGGVMDQLGRVWMAARIRGEQQPAFCKSGSTNKFTQYFPLDESRGNQVALFDPKTEQWTLIDTCLGADHNELGPAPDNALFFGRDDSIGWVNSRILDETGSEEAAQGWCPAILDTSGDGTITRGWTEPDQPIDAKKDHRIAFGCDSISVSPVDGSVWCTGASPGAKQIVRIDRGINPPQTCKAELYEPPPQPGMPMSGEGGLDVDSQGVVWITWRGSDHVTSFDRRKCKGPLNGPKAMGQHCVEGWTASRREGPAFQGSMLSADVNFLIDVDRQDALGLGKDTKIIYAVNSDALVALLPNGQSMTLRVPYPLGFYARNAHARIDDPKGGWKGRGFWSATMTSAVWHLEGGRGQKPKVVKFQFRPDPLAK